MWCHWLAVCTAVHNIFVLVFSISLSRICVQSLFLTDRVSVWLVWLVCLSVCLPLFLSLCLSVCLSVCLMSSTVLLFVSELKDIASSLLSMSLPMCVLFYFWFFVVTLMVIKSELCLSKMTHFIFAVTWLYSDQLWNILAYVITRDWLLKEYIITATYRETRTAAVYRSKWRIDQH